MTYSPMWTDANTPIAERFTRPAPYVLPAAVEQAYRQYLESHHGDLSNPENLAECMFNAGGSHAVKAMIIFGDIVPQLNRIEAKVRALQELLAAFS